MLLSHENEPLPRLDYILTCKFSYKQVASLVRLSSQLHTAAKTNLVPMPLSLARRLGPYVVSWFRQGDHERISAIERPAFRLKIGRMYGTYRQAIMSGRTIPIKSSFHRSTPVLRLPGKRAPDWRRSTMVRSPRYEITYKS